MKTDQDWEERRRVVVTGSGVISPHGDSPEKLHAALCEGSRALRSIERFNNENMPDLQAGEIDFAPREYLGSRNLRPLDRTSQLVTAAVQLALDTTGWTPERRKEQEVGLVLGTMFGGINTIFAFDRRILEAGPAYVKPLDFANSVINAAAGQTAIWHDLRGLNTTVTGGGTNAGLQALIYGFDMIRGGQATTLIAGGGEELCFEILYGFYRAGRLYSPSDGSLVGCVPFEARRSGFALSEGVAMLVLEEAQAACARGATILAEVRGQGGAFDASRGRDPESAARSVERAVRLALADAVLEPRDIDAVSASANGSPLGDRSEAEGLAAVFGEGAAELPVTAIKSMLGEALGASGGLQAVAMLETMKSGVLPGIAGLEQLEEGFPLRRVSRDNRQLEVRRALLTSTGLDGNTCALVIERAKASDFTLEG